MEENNQNTNTQKSNFNVSSTTVMKKKGKAGLIISIIAIVLVIALLAIGIICFINDNKPNEFYKKMIYTNLDEYTSRLNNMDYETVKANIKLKANVETNSNDIDKKILKIINNTNIELEEQMDFENKKFVVNLDSNYENEKLLTAQVYSDIEKEETYIALKNILDKNIKVNMDEIQGLEYYSTLKKLFENQVKSDKEKSDLKKSINILKKELGKAVKEEYCSSSKEELEVNNKKIKVTKNTIKMTQKQFNDELYTVINNLKNNKDFMNGFKDQDKIREAFDKVTENNQSNYIDEQSTIEINTYTQGFAKDIVKVSFNLNINSEETTLTFVKSDKNRYDIELITRNIDETEEKSIIGTLVFEEKDENYGKAKLELNIEKFGRIALDIEYGVKYNEKLDEVDLANSVELDNLTFGDQRKMLTNLQKSKLYGIISEFMALPNSVKPNNVLTDPNNITNNQQNNNTLINTNPNNQSTINQPINNQQTTSSASENQILTYDSKTKITFRVPEGFRVNTTSENFKRLYKGESSIKISSTVAKEDAYYATLLEKVDKYKNDEKYKDVNITNAEKRNINGVELNTVTVSYTYVSGTYEQQFNTKYFWAKANENYIVEFEASNLEEITDSELNEILSIKIENVK
ncbi:MAG: hypothetical protein IJH39_07575 [Clostridia bacterium]|nr:hypothetical protein [Clostridia bacterium]